MKLFTKMRRVASAAANEPLKKMFRPWTKQFDLKPPAWFYEALSLQIQHTAPDVIFNLDIMNVSCSFLQRMKRHYHLLIGQHAAFVPPDDADFRGYDLIFSSEQLVVEYFRRKGIQARLQRMGFEARIADELSTDKQHDLTFMGSIVPGFHDRRRDLLEFLSTKFPQLKIWTPSLDQLSISSPLRKCYSGELWGREVYRHLAASKITLNIHADRQVYANNMRLYEATGVGTLLITDDKKDLDHLFKAGTELVVYHNPQDLAKQIEYFLNHPVERDRIALAGKNRTLSEHTYFHRVQEFVSIVEPLLNDAVRNRH